LLKKLLLIFLASGWLYCGQYVLKFSSATPLQRQEEIIFISSATPIRQIPELNLWRIKIEGNENKTVENLLSFKEVEYCNKEKRIKAFWIPDDPRYSQQWGLGAINMPSAWDISASSGSTFVTIAVIDTGVFYDHEDLKDKMWQSKEGFWGYDFVNGDNDPVDDNGHGTHVAGIAAASVNNQTGISGVAMKPKIMALKVLDKDGYGSEFDLADAIVWATKNGARVINISLGSEEPSSAEEDACRFAYNNGSFIAAATGNDGSNGIYYPARYSTTFSVGAVDSTLTKADFSNYGPELDAVAPGVNILSTVPSYISGTDYEAWDGTSMATPFVSGLAAIIFSIRPDYFPDDVFSALRNSAQDLGISGKDDYYGYGLIDAQAVVSSLAPFEYTFAQKITSFPNPYRISNGVLYFCFEDAPQEIKKFYIYNLSGAKIASLDSSYYFPDKKILIWDGKNSNGDEVSTGIYFYYAETDKGKGKGRFAVIK